MKYKIVTAGNTNDLAYKVNKTIREGWKPHGGIAVSVIGNSFTQVASINLAQAMIKVDNEI